MRGISVVEARLITSAVVGSIPTPATNKVELLYLLITKNKLLWQKEDFPLGATHKLIFVISAEDCTQQTLVHVLLTVVVEQLLLESLLFRSS